MFYVETIDTTGHNTEVFGPYAKIDDAVSVLVQAYATKSYYQIAILDYANAVLFAVCEDGGIRYRGDIINRTENIINWNPDGLDGKPFSADSVRGLICQLLHDAYKAPYEENEWIMPLKIPEIRK